MEPLIRLRLLGSKLHKYEIQHLIQEIINIYGFNKILSFIFNHFLLQYTRSKEHHSDLSNIINMVSNIINSRVEKSKPANKNLNDHNISNKIDCLPSEVIAKCSYYLYLNDYINFSRTNRIIYCASNSPLTLQKLNIIGFDNYHKLNLNRFAISMVKTLCICPKTYNECLIKQNQFTHLNKLHLNHQSSDNHSDIEMFMNSKTINVGQITHLKLETFGAPDNHYDFNKFCHLLATFPNVTHLELDSIYLTGFNENRDILQITPNLNVLDCWSLDGNLAANLLRNTLMNMYSKQLTQLYFDDNQGAIDMYSFANLKELYIYRPKDDSLKRIIDSIIDLQALNLGNCFCSETTLNTIIKSFEKFINMKVIAFTCDSNTIQNIVSVIEMGLLNSKKKNRKTLKIKIVILQTFDQQNVKMREIELYIARIMNALDLSNINDVMLTFEFPILLDTTDYKETIIEKFKETHLAVTDMLDDGQIRIYKIIISNKNSKINGYHIKNDIL